MPSLVEFEVFRDHLGVAADDPAVDDVSRLLDAICAEVRRLTRRDFEGDEGATYTETIRIRGEREFPLPHVPVRDILSIAPEYFDGEVGEAYAATDYRLEDAARGLVRLLHAPEYARVSWRTTGAIEPQVPQAVLEWGKARWDRRDRDPDLAGYKTGDDQESYFASLAGKPPDDVARVLVGLAHRRGGGPV